MTGSASRYLPSPVWPDPDQMKVAAPWGQSWEAWLSATAASGAATAEALAAARIVVFVYAEERPTAGPTTERGMEVRLRSKWSGNEALAWIDPDGTTTWSAL